MDKCPSRLAAAVAALPLLAERRPGYSGWAPRRLDATTMLKETARPVNAFLTHFMRVTHARCTGVPAATIAPIMQSQPYETIPC